MKNKKWAESLFLLMYAAKSPKKAAADREAIFTGITERIIQTIKDR